MCRELIMMNHYIKSSYCPFSSLRLRLHKLYTSTCKMFQAIAVYRRSQALEQQLARKEVEGTWSETNSVREKWTWCGSYRTSDLVFHVRLHKLHLTAWTSVDVLSIDVRVFLFLSFSLILNTNATIRWDSNLRSLYGQIIHWATQCAFSRYVFCSQYFWTLASGCSLLNLQPLRKYCVKKYLFMNS